ncbi:MAG: LuxR C-terminal-related transcriptional regulator, partial [Nocardioidaceae bacterium]
VLGHAAALNSVGDFEAARAAAARALETAGAASPVRTTALSLLGAIAWFDGDAATAIRQMEGALAVTARAGGRLGPIHAQLVRISFSRDFTSALEHAQRAEALLTEEDETVLLTQVLMDRQFGSAVSGVAVPAGLIDNALTMETSHLAEDHAPQPMPLLWFACTDDFAAARRRFTLEERWYRERGEDVWLADRHSHVALAELRAGEVESAEQHVEASCAAVEGLTLGGPRAMVFEKRALVDAHCGRVDRARMTALELFARFERTDQPWWAALTLSTLAFAEYAAGDVRAADAALMGMRERADRVGAVDILFDRSEPFHIEVLLELGEIDRAREALQRLELRGRRLARPWISAALPRSRALVTAATGDIDQALSGLATADLDQAPRLPFEQGWTLLTRGRLERRAKQKRQASETLEAARELFASLSATGFAERADRELARVGLHRAGSALTPTELRVAQLAARGSTNREIAQAAFISPKTVEANLARVYRKLGIRSRAELGAHMAAERRDGTSRT